MLNQFSFRSKITVLIALSVIMASALSFAGYMGGFNLAAHEQTQGAALSCHGMMADMMHEPIISDVFRQQLEILGKSNLITDE